MGQVVATPPVVRGSTPLEQTAIPSIGRMRIVKAVVPVDCLDDPAIAESDEAYVLVDIMINGNAIESVQRHVADAIVDSENIVDASNCLLLPGFVNAHTHSLQILMRGEIGPYPLELWLEQRYALALKLTPEDVYDACMCNAVETLLSGGTAVIDHLPLLHGQEMETCAAAFRAYEEVGMRAFVGPLVSDEPADAYNAGIPKTEFFDRGDLYGDLLTGNTSTDSLLQFLEEGMRRFHQPEKGLNWAIAPTGLQLCTDVFFKRCAELSEKYNLCQHTHLLETKAQSMLAKEKYNGQSGAAHLYEIGFLNERTTCAHSVWLENADMEAMAKSGCTAVHNPLSNIRLGSGIAPLIRMWEKGVNVAYGCDGAASNDGQNMLETLKMGTILQNITCADYRKWPTPIKTVLCATQGGARAIHMADKLGMIGVGRLADVVLYNLADMSLLPFGDPIGKLILCRPSDRVVRYVWVNGKMVVKNGSVVGCDMDRLKTKLSAFQKMKLHKRQPSVTERESFYRKAMHIDD
mmetsp:Transcript_26346/g.43167  ORF Transcript_26346/g.43167 Transcript_26346/m.43167 type:complete len:520 (+) Transcript_26346:80-1639(+)